MLNQFRKWFYETNGYEEIIKVTPIDIKDYKQYLIKGLERKPATVNKALVTLKRFFEWAEIQGLTSFNSTKKIKLLERQAMAPKWLDRNEQNRLLRTILQERNPFKRGRDMAIAQLMLQAGLRVMEVSDLKVTDITVSARTGTVNIAHGKRNKYREVPLNKDCREAIKDYLLARNEHKYKVSQFLFVSERSTRLTTRSIQHLVDNYGVKAIIHNLTCHRLRHTFCHNLIVSGVGIEKVAMLAGHSSLESTRVYTIPGKRELTSAVEKIGLSE